MAEFSEAHDELRTVAREVLNGLSPLVTGGTAPLPADWDVMAASGWLGLEVPEAYDGAGATVAEVAVILHELGRAAVASPYLGSVVLGVGALNLLEPRPQVAEMLESVASGRECTADVLPTGAECLAAPAAPFTLRRDGRGLVLNGAADFVPDATEADRLLIVAGDPDGGPVIVQVGTGQPGLQLSPQPVIDLTRRLALVRAVDVEIDAAAVFTFAHDPPGSCARLLDRGAVATACDSLGVAEAVLEATVAYVEVRHQFGRPVGSFQAVKHACADMLVQVTVGRELVEQAVVAVASGADDAWIAVSQAKSHVGQSAVEVAGKAMQLHGGIGYTWERGIHTFLKRATLNRSFFGSPSAHRRRLGARFT